MIRGDDVTNVDCSNTRDHEIAMIVRQLMMAVSEISGRSENNEERDYLLLELPDLVAANKVLSIAIRRIEPECL